MLNRYSRIVLALLADCVSAALFGEELPHRGTIVPLSRPKAEKGFR